jgi:ATP-binding cassette subfamily F protein 3
MDRIEIDEVDKAAMNIKFPPAPRSGNIVLTANKVSKRYGDLLVFGETDFIIEKGEKIGFVGRNGEGKTTMAKIIMEEIAHSGELKIGHNVKIGYYAQNQPEKLNPDKTVFQTIDDIAVGDIRTKTRDILGSFLFGGEDIDKPVSVLSGGEKSRLSLACMLLEPINLLVMDEPTHHLDIISKDILKQALNKFDGTLILISHDRDFLDGLTSKTFEFRDKKVKEHLGGIDEFIRKRRLERLNELNSSIASAKQNEKSSRNSDQKMLFEERKRLDKEIRKVQKLVQEKEEKISKLESDIELYSEKLANPGDVDIADVSKKLNEANQQLEVAMEMWEKFHSSEEELLKERETLK